MATSEAGGDTVRARDEVGVRHVGVRRLLGLRTWSARQRRARAVVVPDAASLDLWTIPLPPHELLDLDQTDPAERAWVSRCLIEGELPEGEIVELGTWLGAMSFAIGTALRNGGRRDTRLHAFDTFRLDGHAAELSAALGGQRFRDGDSFRHVYEQRIAPVGDVIEVHEGPVERAPWDPGTPIAFLFNDVAKTWSTWLSVRRTFYSALRPGSIVVEQDFAHPYTPWIHLSHHRWRSHFEVVGAIPGTQSVVMRLRRTLSTEALGRNDLVSGFSPREIQAAFDWAESLVEPDARSSIAAARVMLYVLHGQVSVAAAELMKAVSDDALSETHVDELCAAVAGRLVEGEVVTPHTRSTDLEVGRFLSRLASREADRCTAIRNLVTIAGRTHRARCIATDRHPIRSWGEARAVRRTANSALAAGELWRAR